MSDASLAEIAAELYTGPAEDFVAARNALAAEVADPALAEQIRALRKPSIAAWIVNVFARERAADLGQALQLAQELREAQGELDAPALAQLGRQRRALTNRLADDAVTLAHARGGRATPSTVEAVRQTIAAAFFDPDAALAVASGRLIRELAPSSAFPLDVDAAVGGGHLTASPAVAPPVDEVNARRERRKAERAVRDAEQELVRAQRTRSDADRDASDAARRIERLTGRAGELEAELARTRGLLKAARADIPGIEERTAAAGAAVAAAEEALAAARRLLEAEG
ncbi:transposase [Microbacterium sp. SYP-A9085]|uniref:transposase n=1 Tax=Microbacterium sp. SYP-A9085 TaxID=2664454 RepID=UPI00129A3146|nr:transposase [Microbacterium sp. SYP-A9085]MRH28156.1 transposase [Microbacterium sp. SYP-A9085]